MDARAADADDSRAAAPGAGDCGPPGDADPGPGAKGEPAPPAAEAAESGRSPAAAEGAPGVQGAVARVRMMKEAFWSEPSWRGRGVCGVSTKIKRFYCCNFHYYVGGGG
jgi:hypothetical protein